MSTETLSFQAEVREVLNLVIHSLYSNKEIFLRELISNASDACDKLRFEALKDATLYESDPNPRIEVDYNADARTVTIRDNGIGMSRAEVIENIGTIARSGTRRFLEAMGKEQRADANLIGQFGVGFYSAFIVADRVTVATRRAGAPASEGVLWESDGVESYALSAIEKPTRGTEITLHLKADESEFTQSWRLRRLIDSYSKHIAFPVMLRKEPPAKDEKDAGEAKPESAEPQWEQVNKATAMWLRPKSELKAEDYQAFYKDIAHDSDEALSWTHNKVEGRHSYTLLLYLPKKPPFDLVYGNRDERKGLKLYVRRVYIMDAAQELLPPYLRFVRGIVDSDDLPLNVSREILQDNKLLGQMKSACVKRVLDLLEKLSTDEPAQYAEFIKHFGNVLKEGLVDDWSNRERIAKLLRFASTHEGKPEATVSLDDYISRMRPGQEAIYYLTADSFLAAKHSPHLEVLAKKGIECLLLFDRVDDWAMSYLSTYAEKPLRSAAKGELNLDKVEDLVARPENTDSTLDPALAQRIKAVLGDAVGEVRASKRLSNSAAVLVVAEYELPLHVQRLMSQAGQNMTRGGAPALELNMEHKLIQRLAAAEGEVFEDLAKLVHEQALLAEGAQLEDPSGFVQRLNRLLG
jgi:molecular chaperone HtpG